MLFLGIAIIFGLGRVVYVLFGEEALMVYCFFLVIGWPALLFVTIEEGAIEWCARRWTRIRPWFIAAGLVSLGLILFRYR